jgi:hypothetical protein
MIVEFVQFTYPPGLSREQILDDARTTIPRWRGNTELIRKHYLVGEDGSGGAFYIWPSKEAAQRGHNAICQHQGAYRRGTDRSLFRSDHDRGQRSRHGDGIPAQRHGGGGGMNGGHCHSGTSRSEGPGIHNYRSLEIGIEHVPAGLVAMDSGLAAEAAIRNDEPMRAK